jgi:hypothetical protein
MSINSGFKGAFVLPEKLQPDLKQTTDGYLAD